MKDKDADRLINVLKRLTTEVQLFREAYVVNNFPSDYEPQTETMPELENIGEAFETFCDKTDCSWK